MSWDTEMSTTNATPSNPRSGSKCCWCKDITTVLNSWFQKKKVEDPEDPWDWYMYTYVYHKINHSCKVKYTSRMDLSWEYSTNILNLKLMAAFNSPCWSLAKHSMIPWGNFDRINVSRCPGFSSQHLLVHHKTSVGSTHETSWISFYLAILCDLYGMMIRDPFKKVVNETSNDRGSSWVTTGQQFL